MKIFAPVMLYLYGSYQKHVASQPDALSVILLKPDQQTLWDLVEIAPQCGINSMSLVNCFRCSGADSPPSGPHSNIASSVLIKRR